MKIINNKFKIGVIGLGYVGLPLASILSTKYKVIGYDISLKRIKNLKNNIDSTLEISSINLKKLKNICFTNTLQELSSCNVYIIALPTPINSNNIPDLSKIKNASKKLSKIISKKDIIIYESTVYPGVTEEICVPILEKNSGLKFNEDFFCGYSPERINPGDPEHTLSKITKVVSADNDETLDMLVQLYGEVVTAGIHRAPSVRVAEAAKVIENTQRDLNIALVNELAVLFDRLNLNTHDVLEAAGSKWNFLPFKPGLVGGHCIGVDPYYLTYKSKLLGYKPQIILAGRKLNDSMAKYITLQLEKHIKIKKLNKKNLKILMLGVTFKENCPDIRNSQSLKLSKLIKNKYKKVYVYDEVANIKSLKEEDIILEKKLNKNTFDIIILAVPHKNIVKKGIKVIKSYLKQKSIFFDLKGYFNKKYSDFRL